MPCIKRFGDAANWGSANRLMALIAKRQPTDNLPSTFMGASFSPNPGSFHFTAMSGEFPDVCRKQHAPGSRYRKHSDAHRRQSDKVQDAVAVQIVDLAVYDKIKIVAAKRARGGQRCEARAIFQDRCLRDMEAILRELEGGNSW